VTVVIKLGGRVQSDAALVDALASRWASAPGSLCIVHGGGDDISALQRQLGRQASFVNGRRITTAEDIELVRMVLSGSANKRLVSRLVAAGLPAVGISGEDAGLLTCEIIDMEQLGRAGKPAAVNVAILKTLLDAGFLPVISPVGRDAASEHGEALNVNGDDAAAAIAGALNADLYLVADVDGVMAGDAELIRTIDPDYMERLVADGTVTRGMHAKLEAGFAALAAGAASVRIAGLEALTENDSGTVLSLTADMK